MKKIVSLICAAAMAASVSMTAYAGTAEDIAAASGGVFYPSGDGGIETGCVNFADTEWVLDAAVTSAMRICDYSENVIIWYDDYGAGNAKVYMYKYQIDELERRKSVVNEWLAANVPNIIPDGSTKQQAMRIAFDYIVDHFSYDYEALVSLDRNRQCQGTYRMVQEGIGNCASYSKLYRGVLEWLPFDKSWNVNYGMDPVNAQHMKVAVVDDRQHAHEWNAIQDDDLQWYFYDLSGTRTMRDGGNGMMEMPDGSIQKIDLFHMDAQFYDYVSTLGNPDNMIFNY